MAETDIKFSLNAQITENTVTNENKNDKIFTLVQAGVADRTRIISEIMALNPGLEREVVEAIFILGHRVIKKLLLNGYRVNTGLYSAVAKFTGTVEGTAFDPAHNSVYVSFTQGKYLRESIESTTVNVIGQKRASMYFATAGAATRVPGDSSSNTAIAGRNFIITGARIMISGDDPLVGITLTDKEGQTTRIADDMIAVNQPSKLVFLIPDGLADGEYTLTVTTQYSGNRTRFLRTPRSVVQTIYIGLQPDDGDEPDGDDDGDDNEHPLG